MIRSFRCSETERIWQGRASRKFPPEIQDRARERLRALDEAQDVEELREPPGNRLETLGGDRAGQWSIRINRQWRVCFRWEADGPHDVEITDYH